MITRHPLGRQDLRIKRRDKVLEIGPGHDPMFRSDVIADKFPHDDTHRCGKVLIYPHQQFIEADGEQLPFEKDAFDYVICNQVLEHADNPARFIEEMVRVGKRGYVETPSMLGELMFPKESHRWVILLIEDKLVFYEKERMPRPERPFRQRLFPISRQGRGQRDENADREDRIWRQTMKYAGMPFGMWVLMKELGLYDLTPALCHLDYTMSEAGAATNFVRQYTLASGGPYCDCGYKKKIN